MDAFNEHGTTDRSSYKIPGRKARTTSSDPAPLIWAFDPVEEHDKNRNRRMAKALRLWREPGQEIIPVSIFSGTDVARHPIGAPPIKAAVLEAQRRQDHELKTLLPREDLRDLETLFEDGLSRRAPVERLIEFTKKNRGGMIAVHSHGRRGFERARLGSFTETLIALSPVPVMILGPQSHVPPAISKIVFATDYSKSSQRIFKKALQWAERFGAEIILYHQASLPVMPVPDAGSGMGLDAAWWEQVSIGYRNDLEAKTDVFMDLAENFGVTVESAIDFEPGRLGTGICRETKRSQADLIVMGISSGPWNQAIFGTDTREVIADAPVPLMIVETRTSSTADPI